MSLRELQMLDSENPDGGVGSACELALKAI